MSVFSFALLNFTEHALFAISQQVMLRDGLGGRVHDPKNVL